MTMLEAALRYARCGLYVFPLRPGTKKPYGETRGHHDASVEAGVITALWTAQPTANIGIACPQSKLGVLDIDLRNGGDEADLGLMPETWRATTGDGIHVYFSSVGNDLHDGELLPGIDLKVNGYVVAPPSRHPTGRTYCWQIGYAPEDLPLATLPEWIPQHQRATPDGRLRRDGTPLRVSSGQRNRQLFRIGCALRRYGVGEAALLACLRAINAAHCDPALPAAEVAAIAASAARYAVIVPAKTVPPAQLNIVEVQVT